MLKVTYLPQNMFNNICSLMSHFHQEIPAPKKGTYNFCIGGANLQLGSGDGGVSLLTSGCQDCLVGLNRQTILSG